MKNIVRMPILNENMFKENNENFLTDNYLQENREVLELTSKLVAVLEEGEDLNEELSLLMDEFDEKECLDFYNSNIARDLLDLSLNTKMSGNELLSVLKEGYPIIENIVDSNSEIMDSYIDKASERMYGDMYPLYCEPSKEVIRHFIDINANIAFSEIDGNFFAYLTACGSLMSGQIAYAYLMVDNCIPSNILSEGSPPSGASDVMKEEIAEFFGKETSLSE